MENNETNEISYETLAKKIFNSDNDKIDIQLDNINGDDVYIFQLLINIIMNGIYIIYGENFDIKLFSEEIVTKLNKWLSKINYKVIIDSFNDYPLIPYYCRIILKKIDEIFFMIHNIDSKYHFTINRSFVYGIPFENICALFECNCKKYYIRFIEDHSK